jgi:hypothetical protein
MMDIRYNVSILHVNMVVSAVYFYALRERYIHLLYLPSIREEFTF